MDQNSSSNSTEICDNSVQRKRSNGRLKAYESNEDIRSWGPNQHERQEFIQEFIANPELYSCVSTASDLLSFTTLIGALLAKKNCEIRKLRNLLSSNGIEAGSFEDECRRTFMKKNCSKDSEVSDSDDDDRDLKSKAADSFLDPKTGTKDVFTNKRNAARKSHSPIDPKDTSSTTSPKDTRSGPLDLHTDPRSTNTKPSDGSVEPKSVKGQRESSTDSNAIHASTRSEDHRKKITELDCVARCESLEKENEELRRLLSELESERDNLRNALINLQEICKNVEDHQGDEFKKQKMPGGDADHKEECTVKNLIALKEKDKNFLKEHLSKLELLLEAVACIERERERLKQSLKESDSLTKEITELREKICELEEELEDKDDEIEMLRRQLRDAQRREEEVRGMVADNANKLNEVRRRSIDLEDSLWREGGEKEKLLSDIEKGREEVERLSREKAQMDELLKSLEEELNKMKKKEEEDKNKWRKAVEELEETVKAQESEKHRMSITLQRVMEDEIVTPTREAERQEVANLRKASLENETLAARYKDEANAARSAHESELSNLRGSLTTKDEELEKMILEIQKLKDIVKSLEEKRHMLEQLVNRLNKEKELMKTMFEQKKREKGNLELSVDELEINIEYSGENKSSYYLKASNSEIRKTNSPPSSIGDQMLTIPIALGSGVERRLLNRKIYDTEICSQALTNELKWLQSDTNEISDVRLEIWESDKIILPSSQCI